MQEHESLRARRCDARNVIRRSAAGVAVVIGTAGLAGWVLDNDVLRRGSSGFVAMKFNAALLIVLLGVSFLIRSRRGVFALRAFVLVVASLTLAEYALGWHLGIDELVVHDTTSLPNRSPGRMSVTTALCLVLVALGGRAAVMGRRSIAQLAGIVVSLLGWLAALGYLFGAEALYRIGPFSSMAVTTAVAIAMLGLALQATIPGSVVSWVAVGSDLGSQMVRRLITVSLVLLPLLARLVQAATVAGWLRSEFALAVVVLTASLAVVGVAVPLGRRLSAIDHQRAAAAIDLARANGRLEERVEERTAELVRAEAQFRAAFESAPVGMALVASDGRMIRVNESLSSMLGYSRETLQSMSTNALLHSEDIGGETLSEPFGVTQRERRLVCADGSEVWVSIRQTTVSGADDGTSPHAYSLVQLVDVSEQRRFAEQMAHLANHDPLTGLLNRRSFESALEQHVARVERYGAEGAVLLLDLDHFKRINDTYGHSVGDQVIVHVAHAIRSRLRTSDLVARLGGDEFAVLLPSGGVDDARRVADILIGAVRAATTTIAGHRMTLSTSIGLAPFDDASRSADEMLVNADLAMYDAKEDGRDRWCEYSCERYDEPRTQARLGWIERIERALDEDRFVLHAQPVVDLATGVTSNLEILVRMLSDQGETIPPGTFLYVAERYGLATRLDAWVLGQAIEVLAETERQGNRVTIAVNLSGPSLGDPMLVAMIEDAVRAGRFEPSRLVLEVTETSAVRNIGAARSFAERLHELGCRFALDDFGAGFGSFYYLKHLPFDFIKIDGEFVSNCLESRTDQAIIRSLVALARDLGKETVAEHVQNDRTVRFLRRLGVDHGQGFHLGRPVDLAVALADVARASQHAVPRSGGRLSSRAS